MPYHEPTYFGDEDHYIICTEECVPGDNIRFEQATFKKQYGQAKFNGFELITATITKRDYDNHREHYTFTLITEEGHTITIRDKKLYKNETFRKPWTDELERNKLITDTISPEQSNEE